MTDSICIEYANTRLHIVVITGYLFAFYFDPQHSTEEVGLSRLSRGSKSKLRKSPESMETCQPSRMDCLGTKKYRRTEKQRVSSRDIHFPEKCA